MGIVAQRLQLPLLNGSDLAPFLVVGECVILLGLCGVQRTLVIVQGLPLHCVRGGDISGNASTVIDRGEQAGPVARGTGGAVKQVG